MERVPFDPKELDSRETYPSPFPGLPGARKFNTPVAPRDNYLALFRHEMPLWIPSNNDLRMLSPRIDPDNIARCNANDAQAPEPGTMTGGRDRHGIEWVYVPVAKGSMVKPGHPLLTDANEWEKVVPFPDMDEWDWAGSAAANKPLLDQEDRGLSVVVVTGFFERLISLMDFDKAAVAMIDEEQKDAVKALYDRLADLYIDMVQRLKKAYNPVAILMNDDWGGQRSPFFSLATVREMLVPAHKRVSDATHDAGMIYEIHSCGKNEKLVPAYIEMGADIWCGQRINDKETLYRQYGDKIILGLDSDIKFEPETTDEEAVASARRFVRKYGPTMGEKPFLCFSMGASPAFMETVYAESRQMFS
ncbi:MAG: methyltransferase [Clostridiales bacterium]|nr:methyltransferase [Clostridiales bacterium]